MTSDSGHPASAKALIAQKDLCIRPFNPNSGPVLLGVFQLLAPLYTKRLEYNDRRLQGELKGLDGVLPDLA